MPTDLRTVRGLGGSNRLLDFSTSVRFPADHNQYPNMTSPILLDLRSKHPKTAISWINALWHMDGDKWAFEARTESRYVNGEPLVCYFETDLEQVSRWLKENAYDPSECMTMLPQAPEQEQTADSATISPPAPPRPLSESHFSGRLVIDVPSRVITLDGTSYEAIKHAPVFEAFLRLARAEGAPVDTDNLRSIRGLGGPRLDQKLTRHLPPLLRAIVKGQTSSGVYSIVLSDPETKSKKTVRKRP